MQTLNVNNANTINTAELSFHLALEIKNYFNKELANSLNDLNGIKTMLFITQKLAAADLMSFTTMINSEQGWEIQLIDIYQLTPDSNDVIFIGSIDGKGFDDDLIDGLTRQELLSVWQVFTVKDITNEAMGDNEVSFTNKHFELVKKANPYFIEQFLEQNPEYP